MLKFPDRQRKFDQLLAHWEAAELSEQQAVMVGRRERQTSHHIVHDEIQHNLSSSFRRKLSDGLAFITLAQRKNTPARHAAGNASVTLSAPSTNNGPVTVMTQDALLSLPTDLTSEKICNEAPPPAVVSLEGPQTTTQLPRSQTFSYIPRHVTFDGEAMPSVEMQESDDVPQDTTMFDANPLPPTRIPTPSSPQSKRRVSSPRQYMLSKPTLKARPANNHQSSVDPTYGSPSKAVVRSRTTGNLVQANSTAQPANYMAPRRPGPKRPLASSAPQKPVLAENLPTGKRTAQLNPRVRNGSVKYESLAVPSATSNTRSFGPDAPLDRSKRYSLAPPVSAKRLSFDVGQKPVASTHDLAEVQKKAYHPDKARHMRETTVARPDSVVSKSSLTPTLSTVDLFDPSPLTFDNDVQRRTLENPKVLGAQNGAWRSSKIFAAANHQVRRLPRSSTFHHFGKREAPPIPSIPNQFKSPSSSTLNQSNPQQPSSNSFSIWHRGPAVASGKPGVSSRSLLSEIAAAQRFTEAVSLKSVSTLMSMYKSKDAAQLGLETYLETSLGISQGLSASAGKADGVTTRPTESTQSSPNTLASPEALVKPQLQRTQTSIFMSEPPRGLRTQRHWSISERFYPDVADTSTYVQVKDSMPSLYWAGRFQSLFDQWRTEAMVTMLDPEIRPEDEGPLGQCSLEDEKKAILLIFMQLRNLCASKQAADSLHVFEYKYRKDHKMLDIIFDLPSSLRKPEEATPKGPIGRAVRKLTPRKASFANLFKGKGWNRSDDAKAADVYRHVRELQDITDLTTSYETVGSDSYESSTQLHVY